METYPNVQKIPYAPTETADLYPESDGEPMADTDLHLKWILWTRQVLEWRFAQRPDVYISGNIMMYDIEGPLRTAASPDILVSFGIGKKERRTYKVWEEGKAPDFVMEFSSRRTYQNDLDWKVEHYATMGIPEYFLYDVDRRYLPTPLMGYRLIEGAYTEVSTAGDDVLPSEVLNMDFHLLDDGFGLSEPGTRQWLQTSEEAATDRAERAEDRAERAEAEIQRLQEELARLKA